ncbi:MAG TPA: adenylate/guanylate cyclase domain-containing protein [Thermoanaerobaculia bacterium]|nr:adenylate/guanylate cyclase domain-containing protein [Thermoanaerobaculia bacterium]
MTLRVPRAAHGALIGLAAAALIGALTALSPSLFGLEWLHYDALSRRIALREPPDDRIVIVAISEKSISSLEPLYGRQPSWSRELMGRVIEEARRGGAKGVVFDFVFQEESFTDPAGDRRFSEELGSFPTILGIQTEPPGQGRAAWPEELDEKLLTIQNSPSSIPRVDALPPHPLFRTAARIGSIRYAPATGERVARRYSLGERIEGERFIPSLAVAAAMTFSGIEGPAAWRQQDGSQWLSLGPLSIPVDDAGTMVIRWHAADSEPDLVQYPVVDFDRVIVASLAREEGSIPLETIEQFERETFEGKIALVGFTATGLDLRPTPLSGTSAGVEIHANALDALINGRFNREASPFLIGTFMVLATAAFGAIVFAIRSQLAAFAWAACFAAAWLIAGAVALSNGIVIRSIGPAIAILVAWIAITVMRFIAEQRQTLQLKSTFGHYVSPQILEYLLEHPDRVRLGGERRDLTILFSDIRGFTSISEASEPEEVVEMLNEYLSRMVDILLRHGGTLDKFIGDAVMGFWNAPASEPEHPRKAVLCAIEMIEETARLRALWEPEGKPAIRIGIGINTGEAVVGNIGSRQVFGYTVIGDAVNLASRLEGKNKDFGTEIIVSESTRERMGSDIPSFYLDEVKVKGKELAVKIYEIRGSGS